jgi:hypothetical protein
MKLLDRMLNWFCARRRDDQTQVIHDSIQRQNIRLAEMNRQSTEDANAITDYQRRVLDLTARRAAIRNRYDPDADNPRGGGIDRRNGGHAAGGAA